MGFEIKGYVVEPIRVGQSNGTFTQTPDNYVQDQIAFDAAYPSDESEPRSEYMILVAQDGFLESAKFGWTKNEVVDRFDYDAKAGSFKPLPGSTPIEVGFLSSTANTTRLKVRAPKEYLPLVAPFRVSVGSGSGVTFLSTVVLTEAGFTPPAVGTVQVALDTGTLNWNTSDLSNFDGQTVRFQQQQFYAYKDSTGRLGFASDLLLLSPLPGTGQFPLIRFGYGAHLIPVEKASEGSFSSNPTVGTVEWAKDTGKLKFNSVDASTNSARAVYYDGVLFDVDAQLSSLSLGTVPGSNTPLSVTIPPSTIPPIGADLIFAVTDASPYYRFPTVSFVTSFTSGQSGVIQVNRTTGQVQLSSSDRAKYAGKSITYYSGDLPIERGISVRLFRTPVNLDGADTSIKDVSQLYTVEGATLADPVIASPQVFLPSVPYEALPFTIHVVQGQGSYTSNNFPDLADKIAGSGASFSGSTFTDGTATFSASGVKAGSLLVVTNTSIKATYLVATVGVTTLTTTTPAPTAGTGLTYEIYAPNGLGYFIDFDAGNLYFAQRVNQQEIPLLQLTQDVAIQPLLVSGSAVLEKETSAGSGTYELLETGIDVLVDEISGSASLVATNEVIAEGIASMSASSVFDPNGDFNLKGVSPGNTLVVLDSAAKGIYTVSSVLSNTILTIDVPAPSVSGASYQIYASEEILADRYFSPVDLVDPSTSVSRINSLGSASNSPRLSVPLAYVTVSGFRLGATDFSTVVIVPNDGSFTSPVAGTVEISSATGHLNFSTSDLGTTVYWSRTLVSGKDYNLAAGLGQVQFSENLLAREEVLITYRVEPTSTTPPTELGPPIQEYARFLIRKELTSDHPSPTATLTFNTASLGDPHPLTVAASPSPAVFRGGRPQRIGIQCTVDFASSTITFLEDGILTDALPHGAIVAPNERVYIDYYVTQAVGGEKSFTVLNPPIHVITVTLTEGTNSFTVPGDHTGDFQANYLLRVELEQVYLIGGSSYDSGTNLTTVTLAGTQEFQDTFNAPQLYVSSGQTPVTGPEDYFELEAGNFEAIARGSTTILIAGNQTKQYLPGTVLYITDSGDTFKDFLVVSAIELDVDNNRTKVMLTSGAIRQYVQGAQFLSRSVRPVYEATAVDFRTSLEPVLTQPYQVYRRVAGEIGKVLSAPTDYTIDPTGHVVFAEPLILREEFVILYTGRTVLSSGITLRASYTCQTTPSAPNGLLGQLLLADYTVNSPDTFFYRVEKMTNFRGEYAAEIASKAGSGTSGPQTSNISQPSLFEQGAKSLYFDERHLANQDIIARSTLLFYNDLVNLLEDYRRETTGDVVGNNDGKLLFDETTDGVHPPGAVTNQIDDSIKVSDAPYVISSPAPFTWVATSIGTYKKYYLPSPFSRFYPTAKDFFGVVADTSSVQAGDEILDTKTTNITQVSNLGLRRPWGVVTEGTLYSGVNGSGDQIIRVDFASGNEAGFDDQVARYARFPFTNGMKCVVIQHDGTVINDTGSPVTLTSVSDFQVTVSGLASPISVGATIYQSPTDDSGNLLVYVVGRDYSFHGETGQVTYISPTFSPIPPNDPTNTPLIGGVPVQGSVTLTNTLTEPLRSPALFGGVEDDDGTLSFPIQTPDPNSEQSYLAVEDRLINPSTGSLVLVTTPSFEGGTGTVSGVGSVFTMTGSIPSLEQGDLIRIVSGTNANAARYRKVSSVVGPVVTVTGPLLSIGSFTYEAVVSTAAQTGSIPLSPASTTTTIRTTTNFTNTHVGQTLIFTTGPISNQFFRTQVTSVDTSASPNFVTVSPALPLTPAAGNLFKVDNPIATYGGTATSHYLAELRAELQGLIALYSSEQTTLLNVLDQAFTTLVADSTTMTASTTFIDATANFSAVTTSDYLYIQTGVNAGFYSIQNVDSSTQLTLTTPLPFAIGILTPYRIVSLFGLSRDSVLEIFQLYLDIQTLLGAATLFESLTDPIPVYSTVGGSLTSAEFSTGLVTSAATSRSTGVTTRLAALSTVQQQLNDILASTDKLYDKRYVWIDTRINLESGLLVQQVTAVTNRIKAQADILKQLSKLLAVGGS